eukprot:TRINITY_DN503_c0_g3_i1.p1 TRINITY_DN503_c0_g3~~TRINITY_DN503_c0_g3_i1.p1  ORF type:complete len:154 (+),score=42.66 TRINITY_DN503_c0_g3_i1:89-550(+)
MLRKKEENSDNDTLLISCLKQSLDSIKRRKWTGSCTVTVCVGGVSVWIGAEVSDEDVQIDDKKQAEMIENEKEKAKEGALMKGVIGGMDRIGDRVKRASVNMHQNGLKGTVGASIEISLGLVSVEISVEVSLTSVLGTLSDKEKATLLPVTSS